MVDKSGQDETEAYIKGTYETLEKACAISAKLVVLKENSPSCGSTMIYNGVTAALLRKNGIEVTSEEKLSTFIPYGLE